MKQRRFPIVPVTLLVVLLGGAVVMTLKPFDPPPQQEGPSGDVVSGPREGQSAKDIANIAKQQTKKSGPGPVDDTLEAQESGEPALLLPAAVSFKPVPNPTSTSMQWYKDEKGGN